MDLIAILVIAGIAGFIYFEKHKVKVAAELEHVKAVAKLETDALKADVKAIEAKLDPK